MRKIDVLLVVYMYEIYYMYVYIVLYTYMYCMYVTIGMWTLCIQCMYIHLHTYLRFCMHVYRGDVVGPTAFIHTY